MSCTEHPFVAGPGTRRAGAAPQRLFEPINIRGLKVRNRLVMPALGVSFATESGKLSQRYRAFLKARARGGVGMIVAVAGPVSSLDVPAPPPVVEAFIPQLRQMVEELHAEGVVVGAQMHHSGRQPDAVAPGYELVAPSAIPWSPRQPTPRELTTAEAEQLIERHVEAALRLQRAGFDFVEIKACHGYLLSQFLSPHSNKRTDRFGGDARGRATFVYEIIRGIRQRAPSAFVISCRINGADHVEGGLTLDDSKELARLFVEAGADTISVTAGVYGAYPVIVAPHYAPQGCYVHLAEGIKSVVDVPVVAVGRINDPWMAEEVLLQGKADMVAMARPLLADPDLAGKARHGHISQIRPCISCNEGCQDRVPGLPTTCLVNPAMGREEELTIRPAAKAKKALVIGGGLAGLQAACVAAERGHRVTLYEEKDKLGGQWTLASAPPQKSEFAALTRYLEQQAETLGVVVKLGQRATLETLQTERPDAVILAAGAEPLVPDMPGVDGSHVVAAWDVLAGRAATGRRVLVIGGGGVGLETADFLAERGKKVAVVEMLPRVGGDKGPTVRWHLSHRLRELGVEVHTSTQVRAISLESILVTRDGREESWPGFDTVVVAVGARARNSLAADIRARVGEVYIIGDAVSPRRALEAIREATEVSMRL